MRFTVHRPPDGEVSLCWYRPSGGDVARGVHVGVARPRVAGDAREDRLALAVFGCDVPAGRASLRRVRSRDPLESARSFVVEPGNQPTPPLTSDGAVEAALLRDPNTGLIQRAARGAGHRPHIEVLHPNGVEAAGHIGGGLFHPVSPSIGFAGFDFRNRQFGAPSAVGATLGSREALLQVPQPGPLTGCEAWSVQQLSGGKCCRDRHPAVDTDHAAIARGWDRVGDMRESDMPATGPIPSDAVRLDTWGYRPRPAESDPPDLGHPYPPVTAVELFDMGRLDANLAEPLMHAGLAPRGAAMGAREIVPHRLREITQRLLLYGLRSGGQPVIFGAGLGQLRRLFVVPRGVASWLPTLLLLHRQVPDQPGMSAMLQQHCLLRGCRQQPEPRHTCKLATATDTNGRCASRFRVGFPPVKMLGAPARKSQMIASDDGERSDEVKRRA